MKNLEKNIRYEISDTIIDIGCIEHTSHHLYKKEYEKLLKRCTKKILQLVEVHQ